MKATQHSQRADATRNRTRVLEAAFKVFTEKGTSAPISEIAARAGVGPGTVYRHFPAKEDLFRAVVAERFGMVAQFGRRLLDEREPGEAFTRFLRTMILESGDERALADAIIGVDFDVLDAESPFLDALGELLAAAQSVGSVRKDVGTMEVKALLAACYTVRSFDERLAEPVMRVILDGLRATTPTTEKTAIDGESTNHE